MKITKKHSTNLFFIALVCILLGLMFLRLSLSANNDFDRTFGSGRCGDAMCATGDQHQSYLSKSQQAGNAYAWGAFILLPTGGVALLTSGALWLFVRRKA